MLVQLCKCFRLGSNEWIHGGPCTMVSLDGFYTYIWLPECMASSFMAPSLSNLAEHFIGTSSCRGILAKDPIYQHGRWWSLYWSTNIIQWGWKDSSCLEKPVWSPLWEALVFKVGTPITIMSCIVLGIASLPRKSSSKLDIVKGRTCWLIHHHNVKQRLFITLSVLEEDITQPAILMSKDCFSLGGNQHYTIKHPTKLEWKKKKKNHKDEQSISN